MNIILMTLDAFNYELFAGNIDHLPNLAALKQDGVSFENAFSIGGHTALSFPGIVASVYPYYFGTRLPAGLPTIDTMLREGGYSTAFINECNALLTPFFGYGRGIDFQEHFLSLSHAAVDRKLQDTFLQGKAHHVVQPTELMKKIYRRLPGERIRGFSKRVYGVTKFLRLYFTGNTERMRERRKLHNAFRERIVDFIDEGFKEPQFLWVHTIVNHLPYLPPEATAKFNDKEIDYLNYRGLSQLINPRISQRLRSLYVESLRKTDQLVGEVIETLKAKDLLRDTLVIVTADHGEEFQERYVGHGAESSSDALLHVPLIFSWPSQFKGKSVSTPVSTLDILPTIAELAGLQIPGTARGTSLKSFLLDHAVESGKGSQIWDRAFYSEGWDLGNFLKPKPGTASHRKIFTVRHNSHKLKVIEEKKESVITTRLELRDWTNDKPLDIQGNGQVVAGLQCLLYKHLHEEGLFYQATIGEKERIRRRIAKLRKF
jgi:arylsulfatase A-like enzyme